MNPGFSLLSLSRPVICLVVLVPYLAATRTDGPLLALYAISAAFFVASSAVIVRWIPSTDRWRTAAIWGETILAALLNWTAATYHEGGTMAILYAPLLTTYFLVLERRWWGPAVLAGMGGWLLTNLPLALQTPHGFQGLALQGGTLLFFGGVGLLIRSLTEARERAEVLNQDLSDSRAALERVNRQLRESAARQQEMAVLEERQRLAREIHDSVAHSLTALVVQVQAGRQLLERSPAQAAETIARCEQLAREALLETRRAVRALHPSGLEQQADVEALRRLGRDFGIATGMNVMVAADAEAAALRPDPHRLEHLYRIVQESLTNAHRHGKARQVSVALTVERGMLSMVIENDGAPPSRMEPGIGLKSMVERAHELGGSVQFEAGNQGLRIAVSVPVGQEAVS